MLPSSTAPKLHFCHYCGGIMTLDNTPCTHCGGVVDRSALSDTARFPSAEEYAQTVRSALEATGVQAPARPRDDDRGGHDPHYQFQRSLNRAALAAMTVLAPALILSVLDAPIGDWVFWPTMVLSAAFAYSAFESYAEYRATR